MAESLLFSSDFVVSCGTVTLDLNAARVLTIYLPNKDEHLLPKGRINVGEDWRQAAIRETYEETGVHANMLPVAVETRATLLAVDRPFHTEPFARTQRFVHGSVEKTVYWFAATADSSIPHVKGTPEPGEEFFETRWLDYKQALDRLSFESEKSMLQKMLCIIKATPSQVPEEQVPTSLGRNDGFC